MVVRCSDASKIFVEPAREYEAGPFALTISEGEAIVRVTRTADDLRDLAKRIEEALASGPQGV